MNGPALIPIPRVDGSRGRVAVSEQLQRKQPVVFTGLIDGWRALERWSPAWFGATFGDLEVELFDFTKQDAIPATMESFVGWLEGERTGRLAACEDLYLAWNLSVLTRLPRLSEDFDFRALFRPGLAMVRSAFWMGGRGSHTPLHTDFDEPNLHACLHGTKRFVLFAPDQTESLYPSDVYEWTSVFSEVDMRSPDLSRHPNLANAVGHEVVLEPGEVLFLPGGWWHAAWCLTPCVSLNAWRYGHRIVTTPKAWRWIAREALHRLGLYRRHRCTCCGHGDLRRHHGWAESTLQGAST